MTKYEIAANAEIAGISGKRVKLSAAEQTAIFGAYVFGKQDIIVNLDNQGQVECRKSVLLDYNFNIWTLDEVADAVNQDRKLRVS